MKQPEVIPLEKIFIEGIILKRRINNSNVFLNMPKDNDVIVNYDYAIRKLIEKQFIYKYTKSKL